MVKLSVKLLQHQKDAISFALNKKKTILACATGTGKSMICIVASFLIISKLGYEKSLIIGTKSSCPEIINDFKEKAGFEPYQINCSKDLEEFFLTKNKLNAVGILQYEVLENADYVLLSKNLNKTKCGVFVDEAHLIKNPSAQITKVFDTIIKPYTSFKCLLTATPFTTDIDDLYYLLDFLDFKKFGNINNFKFMFKDESDIFFKREHFITGPNGNSCYRLVSQPIKRLAPNGYIVYDMSLKHCSSGRIRRSFSFSTEGLIFNKPRYYCFDKDGAITKSTYVKSVPQLKNLKNLGLLRSALKDIMFTFYPKQDISYILEEVEMANWDDYHQLAVGLDKEDKSKTKMHAARLPGLQKIVDQCPEKKNKLLELVDKYKSGGCIVYVNYIDIVDQIKELFDENDIDYQFIIGDVSRNERKKVKKWFTEDSSNKVLIISSAGGQSLNLQATNTLIFYDTPFGFGAFSQTRGRVVRMFSDHKNFNIIFLCVKDSIDIYKYYLISSYQNVVTTVLTSDVDSVPSTEFDSFESRLIKPLRDSLLWKSRKNIFRPKKTIDKS